jgi:dTDP-4-dehydrorhamnose reductase
MKILVTGANGLLGQHLVKLLLEKNYHVLACGKGLCRLDFINNDLFTYISANITDEHAVEQLMEKEKPEIIIHAAAMTQVDDCEKNPELCADVNVRGTANIILYAEKYSGFIIYVSTDFVFDGEKGNYKEDDDLKPVNWYGFTKVQAESLIETCEMPWAIVRTCLVYGNSLSGTRSNIITWIKEKLEKGEKIKVVDDQIRTPTYVEDLAKGILLIAEKKAKSIFHISGKDFLTPYEMAIKTAAFFYLDKSLIEKVNASIFTQPAKRPPRTGFIIDKAKKELGFEPISFEEGLEKMFGW